MPSVRQRGSYAKFICLHCRKRKIKCVLPVGVQELSTDQTHSPKVTCQRCELKGLDCVVDRTILGRPSLQQRPVMKVPAASTSDKSIPMGQDPPGVDQESNALSEGEADEVDEYLLVKPKLMDGRKMPPPKPKLRAADKFLAMASVPYLLSSLLLRDKSFAIALEPRSGPVPGTVLTFLDIDLIHSLDERLVWHRLYFPDIPALSALHQELLDPEKAESEEVPTTLLLALLCSLALDVPTRPEVANNDFRRVMDVCIHELAHQLLLTLPVNRHTILALELILEYKPLALAIDRTTATQSVRARMIAPAVKEVAMSLGLQDSPAQLKIQLVEKQELQERSLYDCFQWYRICFLDILSMPPGDAREFALRRLEGQPASEVVTLAEDLLKSKYFPSAAMFACHLLLSSARQLENLLAIKADWKDLTVLEGVIVRHKAGSENQRAQLKSQVKDRIDLGFGHGVALIQLIDANLHTLDCWILGVALFFCVMIGTGKADTAVAGRDTSVHADLAMQVSDQIIERFAEPTKDQYVDDPCTRFLIKYGESRTDDLELVLANYLSAVDGLRLGGLSYIPPMRSTLCSVLFTCKDIMEGNAARMKGWGGLHDRAHMQMLLIRNCATSFERAGTAGGKNCAEAVKQGCLWTSTARSLRSLHRLLEKWQEWHALGKAAPLQDTATRSAAVGNSGNVDMLDDLFPEDLFFDWDLWSQNSTDWTLV